MACYKAFVLADGEGLGGVRTFESNSDEAAVAAAYELARETGRQVELWNESRLVARLAPGRAPRAA